MKKLSFILFLSEQQEAVITKSRSKSSSESLTAIKWWISALMILFTLQLLNAQTTTTTCGELFFDDGGASRSFCDGGEFLHTRGRLHRDHVDRWFAKFRVRSENRVWIVSSGSVRHKENDVGRGVHTVADVEREAPVSPSKELILFDTLHRLSHI